MEVQDLERRIKEQEYGRGFDFSAAFPALMRKVYLWMTFALLLVVWLLTVLQHRPTFFELSTQTS